MIVESDFLTVLKSHCLVRAWKVLPRGHIRADTKIVYPDGAAVSVFVEQGSLRRPTGFALSDLGKTFAKLDEYGINPFHPSRLRSIKETVGDLGVRVMDDRLVLSLSNVENLEEGVFKLSQACLRASCMIFNRREVQRPSISHRVHKVVEASKLLYTPNYKFIGPYQAEVKVDYRVDNTLKHSSILILKGSHTQANEVLRRWVDLLKAKVDDRFITIFDDGGNIDKPEDLQRLQDVSEVVSISNESTIDSLLKKSA